MGGVKSFLYPWRSPWRLKKCSASRMAIDVNGHAAVEHEAPTARSCMNPRDYLLCGAVTGTSDTAERCDYTTTHQVHHSYPHTTILSTHDLKSITILLTTC